MPMRKLLTALVLAALCGTASAAEITLTERKGYKPVIRIAGWIEPGDFERFRDIALRHPKAIVVLDGPGGHAQAALKIGQLVSISDYRTYVEPGRQCLSSCALLWIVGRQRYADPTATIGFHGIYNQETKKRNRIADQWIRDEYLFPTMLKPEAREFITAAGPDQLSFLTKKAAKRLGIAVTYAEPDWKAQN